MYILSGLTLSSENLLYLQQIIVFSWSWLVPDDAPPLEQRLILGVNFDGVIRFGI